MTSVDRTAYPQFGRVVSGRELTDSFTPTDDETEWARRRTQDEQHLLALRPLEDEGHLRFGRVREVAEQAIRKASRPRTMDESTSPGSVIDVSGTKYTPSG